MGLLSLQPKPVTRYCITSLITDDNGLDRDRKSILYSPPPDIFIELVQHVWRRRVKCTEGTRAWIKIIMKVWNGGWEDTNKEVLSMWVHTAPVEWPHRPSVTQREYLKGDRRQKTNSLSLDSDESLPLSIPVLFTILQALYILKCRTLAMTTVLPIWGVYT